MINMSNRALHARILTLSIMAGLAGCASTGDLDKLRAEVERVNDTANSAKAQAADATRTANEAKATADQALSTANDANATSAETQSKIDRMFKKAMYK
jgi:murein lipoprotein